MAIRDVMTVYFEGERAAGLTLAVLGAHLIAHAQAYDIAEKELAELRKWRATLSEKKVGDIRAKDESGGVILSPERFVPKEGTLLVDGRP